MSNPSVFVMQQPTEELLDELLKLQFPAANCYSLRFAKNQRLIQEHDTPQSFDKPLKKENEHIYFFKKEDAHEFYDKLVLDYKMAGLECPPVEMLFIGGDMKQVYWTKNLSTDGDHS